MAQCEKSTWTSGDRVWSLGQEDSPGEGHGNPFKYSFLENPMAEEPEGLQSLGLSRVGHNWATKQLHTWILKLPPGGKSWLYDDWTIAVT